MDVLKYATTYGHFEVEHFTGEQALTTAIAEADGAADAGSESLAYIEVWEGSELVRVLPAAEVFEEAGKYRRPPPAYDPPEADVQLKGHDGKWASECAYQTVDGAEQAADRFRAFMGDDRVRVKRLQAAPR